MTGSVFLALVVLLTVIAFVSTVVLWARLASARPWPIAGRAGLMLLVNLLVVLTAGIALNDQYVFFADWTDLRGAMFGIHGGSTSFAGGSAAQAANVSLAPAQPQATPAVLPPLPPGATNADRVLRYTITGTRSGLRGAVLVTLPEGYTDPANAARRYPVLETFHGYPGDPAQWVDSMDLAGALDTAVAARLLAPAITISPTIEFPPGVDTECVDGNGTDPRVETWATRDVPDWVMQTFRALPERSAWATIGLSAGAWCAAMATMLHPEQYAAAIVMGGYFAPNFSANYQPFPLASPQGRRYDLVALAKHKPPPVALWIETSHSDPVSYPSSAALLAAAHPPLSIQALVLTHAGHRISIWHDELPQTLVWLGKNLRGFAAQTG